MEVKLKQLFDQEHVSSVDKLMILLYNLVLAGGASYLVYYKDASAWLFLMVLVLAGSWKGSKNDD